MNDEARGRGAFLARPAKSTVDREVDGAVEIGVVHDYEGIFRAHFELKLHEARRGCSGDP
jgi:hypothetical protein